MPHRLSSFKLLARIFLVAGFVVPSAYCAETVYDARIAGKEILTPKPSAEPKITGAEVFGVRPGKPIRFRVSATGDKPIDFAATGLPEGVHIDPRSGWIT